MPSKRPAHGARVLVLVLFATACPPPVPPSPALAECTSQFESLSDTPVVLRVGQVETLTFIVRAISICDGVSRDAETVVVEAADDSGRDVPVTVQQTRSLPPSLPSIGLNVTFTAPETSSVFFRLRAEPSLGLIQRSFPVVTPMAPSWEERPIPGTCNGALEGPDGGLFCLEAPATVRLVDGPAWRRDDVNSAAFTTDATGVVRLWLFPSAGGAEVWRLDRGVPQLAATEPLALVPTALHARGRRVVIAGTTQTNGITVTQLEFAAQALGVRLPPGIGVGALRFVSDDDVEVARGERLDVVRPSVGMDLVFPPAPRSRFVTPVSVSVDGLWYAIDTGGTRNPLLGSGGGAASGNQDVQVVRPDGGVGRVAITNRLGAELGFVETSVRLPPMHLTDVVPIWFMGRTTTGTVVTAVPIDAPDGGLALRYLETEGTRSPMWANSRWVYGPPTPGRLLRMRREP